MASTSYGGTPAADFRRRRAAQFSFEPPSFSLGIDSEVFGFDDFHECAEPLGADRVEGEEESGWRSLEKNNQRTDEGERGAEGCHALEIDRKRPFKRLKKGLSSHGNETPQKTPGSQARPNNLMSTISSPSSAPSRSHLPVKDSTRNQLQDFCAAHLKPVGGGQTFVKEPDKEAAFSSGSQQKRRLSLFRPGASPSSSRDTSQRTATRDCNISKDGISSQWEPLHTKDDGGNGVAEEVDDIEELSDNEFFSSRSRLQQDHPKVSTPQKSGPDNPVLISSSPEGSEKPVLHIPGAAGFRSKVHKAPLKLSQTPVATETPIGKVDPISRSLDDFDCGSGRLRKGLHDLDRPSQTFQRDNATTTSGGRLKPPFSAGKSPNVAKQSGVSRDGALKSFFTKTPKRADTVGPSQASGRTYAESTKRDDEERRRRDEQRVQAFLRQRLPHFKSVDALLLDGGLDNEPVYIDYRNQFGTGTRCRAQAEPHAEAPAASAWDGGRRTWPAVRSIRGAFAAPSSTSNKSPNRRRANGNKKSPARSQAKKRRPTKGSSSSASRNAGVRKGGGSGKPADGKWRTVNGSRVFIVGENRMSGQRAYSAYLKGRGGTSSKKRGKRPPKKSK